MAKTSLKIIDLRISRLSVGFTGCNLVGLGYTATSNQTIKFGGVSKTKVACPDDNDDLYIGAMESAVKYSESKGVYTL